MSQYANNKYKKANSNLQSSKQYVADKVVSEQHFEQYLKKISLLRATLKEKAEKDIMLNKGIEYAYFDINGEGIENLPVEYRTHKFFVRGYEIGNRRRRILGVNIYINGSNLEEVPENIRNHHEFIYGYQIAKNRVNTEEKIKKR